VWVLRQERAGETSKGPPLTVDRKRPRRLIGGAPELRAADVFQRQINQLYDPPPLKACDDLGQP